MLSCCRKLILTIPSALFDLHNFVLHRSDFHELHDTSRAALRTTVRMIVDVARSFNQRAPEIDVEVLPPRCSHLARAGQYLLDSTKDLTYEGSEASLNEIKTMLSSLNQRWRLAGIYTYHKSIASNCLLTIVPS